MSEGVFINPIELYFIGTVGAVFLGIISYFLARILGQFDQLNVTVLKLNGTMMKIDKDLSGEILVLKNTQLTHTSEIKDLNILYDRLRATERDVSVIQEKCVEVNRKLESL